MSPEPRPAVQMANITKTFPGGVVANDSVTLTAWGGSIHAIVGENGAGKSTLMGILYGRLRPDDGRIRLFGDDVHMNKPADAIALGVGIVTQHTTLVPALTVIDNILLGSEPGSFGRLDRHRGRQTVAETARSIGVDVDWNAPAGTLSVASLQKAELVKALVRGARVLILDEPTAMLAPSEAQSLFVLLHSLAASGSTILFITHKLTEVMQHSSRVTVLRGGRTIGEVATADTSPDDLLGMMLAERTALPGRPLTGADAARDLRAPGSPDVWAAPRPSRPRAPISDAPPVPVLEVKSLMVRGHRGGTAVRDVSFDVNPGEILGVAGVDGSGQRELAQAIVGLRRPISGDLRFDGHSISASPVVERLRRGLTYIPEDRRGDGLVLPFSIEENMLLGRQRDARFGGGAVLDSVAVRMRGSEAIHAHMIRASGPGVPAELLSGGNQQKVMLARALAGNPKLLVAMQPTRGLDAHATRLAYGAIRIAQEQGLGVLLFSLDLDEILEVAHRVAVMYSGTLAGILVGEDATHESVGRLMTQGAPEGGHR